MIGHSFIMLFDLLVILGVMVMAFRNPTATNALLGAGATGISGTTNALKGAVG